jgi:hypothetical protein
MISRRGPGTATPARLASLELQVGAALSALTDLGDVVVEQVPITFATSSPLLLRMLTAGSLILRAALLVESPFDPGATLRLGTFASPGLILSASDSELEALGQYESDLMVPIPVAEGLVLSMSPGLTQGSALLLYSLIA